MPEPNERDKELALSATSGEGLSKAVMDRIERACAKAREEGRRPLQFLLGLAIGSSLVLLAWFIAEGL